MIWLSEQWTAHVKFVPALPICFLLRGSRGYVGVPSLTQPTVTVSKFNGVVSTGAGGMAALWAVEVLEFNRFIYLFILFCFTVLFCLFLGGSGSRSGSGRARRGDKEVTIQALLAHIKTSGSSIVILS